MKKFLILFMLALLPLFVMGQAAGGQVKRPVKKQQTTTTTPAKKPAAAKRQTTQSRKPTNIQTPSLSPVLQNLINNMVYVEGGTFMMGATSEQGGEAWDDEKAAHQVALSSYSIGRYEVTQEEWVAVMGGNPSYFKDAKRPVEQVSWNDCQEFICKLNEMTGKLFRLPTEAEWEYAARGGNRSRGYKYSGSNSIGSVTWYTENSGSTTHPVGKKQANELGLYDMTGNVLEWCQDLYGIYSSTNPIGPLEDEPRVRRGGGWGNGTGRSRVSSRSCYSPDYSYYNLGFRLAL